MTSNKKPSSIGFTEADKIEVRIAAYLDNKKFCPFVEHYSILAARKICKEVKREDLLRWEEAKKAVDAEIEVERLKREQKAQ